MIDIHGHFLPGVDDGAKDMAQCLAMLEQAIEQGVTHVVMTPHYWPGVFDTRTSDCKPIFDQVVAEVAQRELPISLSLAGEVRLSDDNIGALISREVPFIGQWQKRAAVLLELPDGSIPPGTIDYVTLLLRRGIQPIIAHPERIKSVMRDHNEIEPFIRAGCLTQLTCASVTGAFGAGAHETAWHLLRNGWAHFLASDAHNLDKRPSLNADAADLVASELGLEAALNLTLLNPSRLLGFANEGQEGLNPGLMAA